VPLELSPVGGLQLPVPAGAAGEKLTDPVVEALLDFSAFYIKNACDAKVANFSPAGTQVDACPVANQFTFDPLEARGHQVKLPVPSLYVFWQGDSKSVEWTIFHTYRVREIHLMYAFEELPSITAMTQRHGLLNSVDAALHKMSKRQLHSSFTPSILGPTVTTAGVCMGISQALGDRGVVDWKWLGGHKGRFGIDEGPLAERRAAKKSGRDFPALLGKFEVWERITEKTMSDGLYPTGDGTPDISVTINASGGETNQTVEFLTGVLGAPDGSEDLDDC